MSRFLVAALLAFNVLGRTLPRGFAGAAPDSDPQVLLIQDSHKALPYSSGYLINQRTSLTLLHQNNLKAADGENHFGIILLDPMGQHDLRDACEEIGESMVSLSNITDYKKDFLQLFSYLFYLSGQTKDTKPLRYYIRNGVLAVTEGERDFDHYPFPSRDVRLPVLCTQTSSGTTAREKDRARQLVRVNSEGNTYIGSRDHKSFRFLGIPYADPPIRFSYAKPYSGKSRTIHAKEYGPRCVQADGGSENCLSLNIQTPYIPKKNSTFGLRPVLFWIHGGDFTRGTGSDPVTDGGNLASREGIVVVTFNYRLSTLGFLAVPDTDIRGNYGLADQVLALEWTIKNIAQFGGDPRQITIMGEAAGATSVKALLGSEPASGSFQRAVAMSDLGSGIAAGFEDRAASYNSYATISQSYEAAGQHIFFEAGCNSGTIEEQIQCLRDIPASTLANLATVARHIVQDGKYIHRPALNLGERNSGIANVPVIFGNTYNEGASFIPYSPDTTSSLLEGITSSLGITREQAQRLLDTNLIPTPHTGNLTLDAFTIADRIATNTLIRCPNQASLLLGVSSDTLQPSYYYQTFRTMHGLDTHAHGLGNPPPSTTYPHGDPDRPYFRLHASDLPFVFANLPTIRDSLDLAAAELISAYFAEFVRSGQPNPDPAYLEARGYKSAHDVAMFYERWEPVSGVSGPIMLLDFPSNRGSFWDSELCKELGVPLELYKPLA
ncbi:Alpha/Beta hydrolase protein [Aspergillus karnatakaensis]|uniref:putative carboxylesterase n=1 Tax=Aspergillus karnatakaensis TaxID=1810916 RepID=UPI003CCCC9AC